LQKLHSKTSNYFWRELGEYETIKELLMSHKLEILVGFTFSTSRWRFDIFEKY